MRANLPTESGVTDCKKCLKRPFSAPGIRLPNHVALRPEFCAIHRAHFWPTFEGQLPTKIGVAGCLKCAKMPLSAPEVWLPNHVVQHPEFCSFHMAHFWLTFEGQLPTEIGVIACRKSHDRVPDNAAFGTQRQAAQSRGPAPNTPVF